MTDVPPLILASASQRRSQLLTQIGVPHLCIPVDIDESVLPGEAAGDCVRRLAERKALCLCERWLSGAGLPGLSAVESREDLAVLGADTLVEIEGRLLGKPRDRADALTMLGQLSGRRHRVCSAVALALVTRRPATPTASSWLRSRLSESQVGFRALTGAECTAYWDSGEPRDKAGAYAIQGLGAVFVESLQGSFSGVMGLPLFETAELLRQAGLRLWAGRV